MAGKGTISITFKLDTDNNGFKTLSTVAEGLHKALDAAESSAEKLNRSVVNFSALAVGFDSFFASLDKIKGVWGSLSAAYSVQEVAAPLYRLSKLCA